MKHLKRTTKVVIAAITALFAIPSVHTYAYNSVEGKMDHDMVHALPNSPQVVEHGYKHKKKAGKTYKKPPRRSSRKRKITTT